MPQTYFAPTLRPEARPLAWQALDVSQKGALRELAKWLECAVDDVGRLPAPQSEDWEFWLDPNRSSRIVMLEGERGSGKTTALLSFVKACHSFGQPDRRPEETGYPEDLRPKLEEFAKRTVWLEPIDMEPMSPVANLLASILVRIESSVHSLQNRNRSPTHGTTMGGVLPGSFDIGPDDPMLELVRFESDIALSWEGNIHERKAQLDPDIYATEVLRSERARLSLNKRLNKLLDSLTRSLPGKLNPIFVLPIDDFDLSPAKAVTFLRLLRMFSVPRLFFIVLGHEPMTRMVFGLYFIGELMGVAYPANPEAIRSQNVSLSADRVAINALRKLLPPNQRIRLGPMQAKHALAFNGSKNAGEENSLEALISFQPFTYIKFPSDFDKKLPVLKSTRIEDFRQILDAEIPRFQTHESTKSAKRRRGSYGGRTFFRLPPRRVYDLWARLDQLRELDVGQRLRRVLNMFGEQVQIAIDEDPLVPSDTRHILKSMVRENWEGDLELDAGFARFSPPPPDPVTIGTCRMPFGLPSFVAGSHLQFRQVRHWYLTTFSHESEDPEAISCSLFLRGIITLFADFVAMYDRERLARGSIRTNPLKLGCAIASWELTRESGVVQKFDVHWPSPDWESVWPYDLLLSAFTEGVRWFNLVGSHLTPDEELEFLAFVWICTATALVGRVIPQELDGSIPPSKENWEKLANAVGELAEQEAGILGRDGYRRHIRSWLINLACLLSTETGVPWNVALYFFGKKSLRKFWGEDANAREIRRIRALAMNLEELMTFPEGRILANNFIYPFAVHGPTKPSRPHPVNLLGHGKLIPKQLWISKDGERVPPRFPGRTQS